MTRKPTQIFFLAALSALSLACACSSLKPTSNTDESDFPIQWSQAAFPHPEGWEKALLHGMWVNSTGYLQCVSCHNGAANPNDSAPPCSSCHPLFPHEEGWGAKDKHGSFTLQNGPANCKTLCHGADLGGGLSQVSCTSCHSIYPHPSGFSGAASHGEIARTGGTRNCASCHGEDLGGGLSGVSCRSCHASYPHAVSWQSPENHGALVLKEGSGGCKTLCHGAELGGGLSQVSCASCHSIYPHPSGWREEHGASAESLGNTACAGCHGNDYEGGASGVGCRDCHGDYPHPNRTAWLPFEGGHGEAAQPDTGRCAACHGADLRRTLSGQDCYSCHTSYPHASSGSYAWRDFEGHGEFTLTRSKEECRLCHGDDYRGGERLNPSCFSCHAAYPHMDGWQGASGHGAFVISGGTSSCATTNCHGIDFSGGNSSVACGDCHADYPHTQTNWVAGASSTHVTVFTARIRAGETTACQECHGADYNRDVGSGRCLGCHPDGITHTAGWALGAGHGVYYSSRFTSASADQNCKDCHGAPVAFSDLKKISHDCWKCHTFGISQTPPTSDQTRETLAAQSTCYSCHFTYPHTGYSAFYIGTEAWSSPGGGHERLDAPSFTNRGHIYYMMRNPLMTNSAGYRPWGWDDPEWITPSDPENTSAIEHSCGGSESGTCHFEGHRSAYQPPPSSRGWPACSEYCHKGDI